MKELEQIFFKNRNSFRLWLKDNHQRKTGIWMLYYKKHTNKECVTYRDALEEALCFGWIDSIVKRIDDESYLRMFTPRRNISNWSDLNKSLVVKLIDEGLMTEAGLNKIDDYVNTGKIDWKQWLKERKTDGKKIDIPEFFAVALAKNPSALKNFNDLNLSNKRQYVYWLSSTKREETKNKRLKEAILLLTKDDKMGIK